MSQNLLTKNQFQPVGVSLIQGAEFPVRIFWLFFNFQFYNTLKIKKMAMPLRSEG